MTVSPATVASLQTGATQQFTAQAELSDGSTSSTDIEWSVTGGGAISASGLYTAPGAPQTADITVTASRGGKSGSAVISEIVSPPPTIVAKAAISGKVGGSTTAFTTMFTATNSAASDYNFVVTPTEAGTVSAAGLLTLADTASGDVTVKATHKTVTSVTATATLTGVVPKS